MSDFAIYGTPFEVLEDEEKDAITRKPKGIQDEIVTDEKGRRRFHGAFTGGFSAGYFNSVGSKHGWVPQTFKSSRESRAEKIQISAEDLMDDEDMGEFGIASRKIRPKRDFMDAFALPGEKQLLAWERSVLPSSSSISDEGLSAKLAEIIRPV
uniref:G patch domain-containing protein n=1 Tax=Acrobeloides nanus TaxID=290746 RepID=A0A914D327_9BILA